MPPEPLGIILAHALDAADHDLVALLDPLEPDAPVKRQILLRRIDDLQQMPLEPGRGKAARPRR